MQRHKSQPLPSLIEKHIAHSSWQKSISDSLIPREVIRARTPNNKWLCSHRTWCHGESAHDHMLKITLKRFVCCCSGRVLIDINEETLLNENLLRRSDHRRTACEQRLLVTDPSDNKFNYFLVSHGIVWESSCLSLSAANDLAPEQIGTKAGRYCLSLPRPSSHLVGDSAVLWAINIIHSTA